MGKDIKHSNQIDMLKKHEQKKTHKLLGLY